MANGLAGKNAVVTGAGGGIGKEISLVLAAEGAKVVVNDPGVARDGKGKSSAPADETVNIIKQKGGQAVPNYDSVTSFSGAERIIKTCIDSFGRIDIMVNVAGILRERMIWNMTEEEWDAVIQTNLTGAFFMSQQLGRHLIASGRPGCIINIGSTHGMIGLAERSTYGISKAGMMHMTKMLAIEWAQHGINVNAVAPGPTATDLFLTGKSPDLFLKIICRSVVISAMCRIFGIHS